jgi:hypothetical protein
MLKSKRTVSKLLALKNWQLQDLEMKMTTHKKTKISMLIKEMMTMMMTVMKKILVGKDKVHLNKKVAARKKERSKKKINDSSIYIST